EEALRGEQQILGPRHLQTLITMNNLGSLLMKRGQLREARKLLEETLQLKKDALPRGHPETLLTISNLAWLLATAGEAKVRDPKWAVELAKELTEHAPAKSVS